MFDQVVLGDGAPAGPAAPGAAGGDRPAGVVGGDGAAVLDRLDLAGLDDHDLIEALVACSRQQAAAEARLQQALAAVAARQDTPDGDAAAGVRGHRWEFAADQVAAALGMTPRGAQQRLGHASRLCRDLPATLAALAAGVIDGYKARILVEEVETLLANTGASSLDPALAVAAVEARVLPRAGAQTPAQLRAAARRAVLRADPAAADARHAQARTDRGVRVWPLPDGMAARQWTDTAANILRLYAAVDALAAAAKTPGDDRSAEQRRADTLADLGHRLLEEPGPGGLTDRGVSESRRPRAQLQLVVPAGLLLGLTNPSPRSCPGTGVDAGVGVGVGGGNDQHRDPDDSDSDPDHSDQGGGPDHSDRDRDGGDGRDRGGNRDRGGGADTIEGGEDPAELAGYGPIRPRSRVRSPRTRSGPGS